MSFIIGLLTFVLLLNCLILVLLVLIQLPKKEAGLGLAFGGGAADALFGAGSGNVLTKATKYAAGAFFVLTIGVGLLYDYNHRRSGTELERELRKAPPTAPIAIPPAGTPPAAAPAESSGTPAPAPATPPAATPAPATPTTQPPANPALPPATPPQ